MESVCGVKGVHQMASEETPVEYIEIVRLKSSNIDIQKGFDKNHVIKTQGRACMPYNQTMGKTVISHIQKCIPYAFSNKAGDKEGLEKNLRALIPHNFEDHPLCEERFCGSIPRPSVTYIHQKLPYKASLSDSTLRKKLDAILEPIIRRADQYCDLGSTQQCEHANREVALRAPKFLHYGDTEALDFRVQPTIAFINEGRHYITQVITVFVCLSFSKLNCYLFMLHFIGQINVLSCIGDTSEYVQTIVFFNFLFNNTVHLFICYCNSGKA